MLNTNPLTTDQIAWHMGELLAQPAKILPIQQQWQGKLGHTTWRPAGLADGLPGIATCLLYLGQRYQNQHFLDAARLYIHQALSENVGELPGLYGNRFLALGLAREWFNRFAQPVDWPVQLPALALDEVRHLIGGYQKMQGAGSDSYDLCYGLTGCGVYLLETDLKGQQRLLLYEVLNLLVAAVLENGSSLSFPAWIFGREPPPYLPDPRGNAHIRTGIAHGLAGPLLLLDRSQRAGHKVAGQREALNRLRAKLLGALRTTPEGLRIADWLSKTNEDRFTLARHGAWCVGGAGTAWALARTAPAGRIEEEISTLCEVESQQFRRDSSFHEWGFCHGLAGFTALCLAGRSGSDLLLPITNHFQKSLQSEWNFQLPLGIPRSFSGVGRFEPLASADLLTGLAGIAMTTARIRDFTPHVFWESFFLLS